MKHLDLLPSKPVIIPSMAMWVHRLSRGVSGGQPTVPCNAPLDLAKIESAINASRQTRLTYPTHQVRNFLMSELFAHGRLRQGWGAPGLDLTLPDPEWIENYLLAAWVYWDERPTPDEALGRKRILDAMTQMAVGDIVFLPNCGANALMAKHYDKFENQAITDDENLVRAPEDDQHFTVVTIAEPYRFEDRSHQPATWKRDFGHVLGIRNAKAYAYAANNLLKATFSAPYRHAVDPVHERHTRYATMAQFLERRYL
jgi:hypothetical protein